MNNANAKSFVLGLALAIIIGFGVQSVVASSTTLKYLGQESGLVNKIGSLTVGQASPISWIDWTSSDPRSTCMTSKPGTEDETCLGVSGVGAFSKLMVLDIPAFVTDTLFLNNDANSNTIAGLPTGLVLEDTGGDDSIMVSGLQRNEDGSFMPVNTTDKRGLCASETGVLYPCDIAEPVETYHWDEGVWGSCSAASGGSCSGTYATTIGTGGACIGSWQSGGSVTKVDWSGNSFTWQSGRVYEATNDWDSFCGSSFDFNIGDSVDSGDGSTACIVSTDPNYTFPGTYYDVNIANNVWDILTVDGSGNVTSISSYHPPLYSSTGGATNQCSGPTSSSSCTSQNAACSWHPGTSGGGSGAVGSSGPYASCFIADTQITLANGTKLNIQDVVIGDVLKGQTSDNTVVGFHQPKLGDKKLYSYNGGEYFVTAEHPFMTTTGWKAFDPELAVLEHNLDIEIDQLSVGDILVTENGNILLETVHTKSDNADTQLYNFILTGDKTYYADGYLVHNKVDCSSPFLCGTGSTCYNQIDGTVHFPSSENSICSLTCSTPGEIFTGTSRCNYSPLATEQYCGDDNQRHCRVPSGGSGPIGGGTVLNDCSGPTSSSACTSQNNACTWTSAGTSVATRNVVCRNSANTQVDDAFCPSPKPPVTSDDSALSGGNFCEVASTGTPFTCTSSGWQIDGFDGDCSPVDYVRPPTGTIDDNAFSAGTSVCSANGVAPEACFTSSSSCSGTYTNGSGTNYCQKIMHSGGGPFGDTEVSAGHCGNSTNSANSTNCNSSANQYLSHLGTYFSCTWGGGATTSSCSSLGQSACNSQSGCTWN